MAKAKFTQKLVSKPMTYVTAGMIQSGVQAFREGITGAAPIVSIKGYGDNTPPGERDLNIKRTLGASNGPGTVQKFVQKKK